MRSRNCGVAETETQPGSPRGAELLKRAPLKVSRDVVVARQAVAAELKTRGVSSIRVTRFATAVSESARKAIVHGGGGEIALYLDARKRSLIVECRDRGQGIEDVEQAMKDGFTSGGGLGKGLGGARRLSDDFEIVTAPGQGTLVRMSARL